MPKFAQTTEVTIEKTIAEIKSILVKYKAKSFGYFQEDTQATVFFESNNRRLRFVMPLPDYSEFYLTPEKRYTRSKEKKKEAWEQACRQRWRALLLSIKAKLEAVECGLSTFEVEFMAYTILPNNQTVAETLLPQIENAYLTGKMPNLLPAIGETTETIN